MSSYLLNRNGHYHVRIRIPSDLTAVIPATELVKSLKTTDAKAARLAALPFRKDIFSTFTLYRSGFISGEQARESIDRTLNRKGKATPSPTFSRAPDAPCAPSPTDSLPVACPSLKPSPPMLLSTAVNQYVNDRKNGWGAKTRMENEGSYRLMLDLLGDAEVASLDRLAVRSLRDKLIVLPANLFKLYPTQTAREVLELIQVSPSPDLPPMSITTVNKHISRLSSLMKHCMKEGYLTSNPAVGLKIKQKRRPDEERKAYTAEDLKRITANLPPKENKPERYWVPLVGMMSALRLDESCQLYTEDVKEIDGVWCFDVNDEGDKKLKTLSSKRIVPVHPTLISLGFLDHVASMKVAGHPRLWMNLHWRKEDGYGNAFGKWFQRFNRQHVTTDPLKSFHSLRHSFADTLKQQGEQEAIISELMGHANGNITTGRYGKRYRAKALFEAMNRLSYPVTTSTK
ncbi:site-specific integrase [Geomonas terrae]|uniref:Site-specific integrase n=1 Tax=Geomonas terrae TaxID=2562681 RepID=A0A4S1CCK9_9BACT|nr:site-specific integrase [Geomonas terrae]TGU70706.1 site-specific integrase [Geomonas terrae]